MKLNVYVDAFNLYYGVLKGTPYKWLNLRRYCELQFPNDSIHRIRYFTARVQSRANNPDQDARQDIYLRALQTVPNLELHFGHYLSSTVSMPLAFPLPRSPRMVQVLKSEEKGSDVNIAVHMILDAVDADCEGMILLSDDSDLAEPVNIITSRFKLPVTTVHPIRPPMAGSKPRYPSGSLRKVATRSITVTQRHLKASQFPSVFMDNNGNSISKPPSW